MTRAIVADIEAEFRAVKALGDKALVQLDAQQMRACIDAHTNSAATIVKHMAGNFHSRFADFLTTDGEKPGRDRDDEFVDDFPAGDAGREAILARWESGWACVLGAMATLSDADLQRIVTIRSQPHTVMRALTRSLAHAGYHTGQLMWCARAAVGPAWKTVTIARGGSHAFNTTLGHKPA
ncbi:MAG TPA: DUF1572 family protein [Phycisphaerales bacterium]|nr:DUF1572 family protein [Phycisphaerales bacterium]